MVYKIHYIELYINSQKMELESQESLGIRMNNVIYNPTKIRWEEGEYSYSFNIPSTPHNDKVLDHANNLSKTGKFHTRYSAKVIADGCIIFDGSLTISKYDGKNKQYQCNLVSIKVASFDELFGEDTLNKIPWFVPFDGHDTINAINNDPTSKYYFPLVSYGCFQKKPYFEDEVAPEYTSKFDIDMYNKWWIESFYPSLNVLEQVRRAFQWKGFRVLGSAFNDPVLSNIYSSCNLSNEQVPLYNLGNPKFGKMSVKVKWDNYSSVSTTSNRTQNSQGTVVNGKYTYYTQDLSFPYEKVEFPYSGQDNYEWNYSSINVWNILNDKDSSGNTLDGVDVQLQEDTYMFDPGESVVVIPATGFYRIRLKTSGTLKDYDTTWYAKQWKAIFNYEGELSENIISVRRDLKGQTPFELHLVRNYNDNIELIKGRQNRQWVTGDPNEPTYTYAWHGASQGPSTNYIEWYTEYPHEELYSSRNPTEYHLFNTSTDSTVKSGESLNSGIGIGGQRSIQNPSLIMPLATPRPGFDGDDDPDYNDGRRNAAGNSEGYMHKFNTIMPYDPGVSPSFICGFSTMHEGQMAVIRDGNSVYKSVGAKNNAFYEQPGLQNRKKTYNYTTNQYDYQFVDTTFGYNVLPDSYNFFNCSSGSFEGCLEILMKLEKNDQLELMAITRQFENRSFYGISLNAELEIEAVSPRDAYNVRNSKNFGFNMPTEFDYDLNLSNFCNNETKISDWIDNVATAFNLTISQDGNVITIDKNDFNSSIHTSAVKIDDRTNAANIESSYIDYPKEMSVKYSINTEEWGFERTVPLDKINLDDWKEYGDSGFTVVTLNDDSYVTSTENINIPFSYTYYDNFNQLDYTNTSDGSDPTVKTVLRIPVIEESQYMADGYGYEDAMAHDGYSMTQRFWFRQGIDTEAFPLVTSDVFQKGIEITCPTNEYAGVNLSYKLTEKSLLTEYFNIDSRLSSNYITVDVYLTPDEYKFIKSGGYINVDSDLYAPVEISGYDPSGANTTKLKLMKVVK